MCDECRQTTCPPQCPNAAEPRSEYTCAECGEGIYSGEDYIHYGRKHYHADCVESMTAAELAEAFELTIKRA